MRRFWIGSCVVKRPVKKPGSSLKSSTDPKLTRPSPGSIGRLSGQVSTSVKFVVSRISTSSPKKYRSLPSGEKRMLTNSRSSPRGHGMVRVIFFCARS